MVIVAALFSQILIVGVQCAQLRGALLVSQEWQEWQSTPQVEHKLPSLNNFLRRTSDRSVSPVRSQCKSEVLTGAHY